MATKAEQEAAEAKRIADELAEAEAFDWDSLDVEDVDDLGEQGKKNRIPEKPPAAVIAMAQASRDENAKKAKTFPTNALAEHFARKMRDAGYYTEPKSGMFVQVGYTDKDGKWITGEAGKGKTVRYSAGEERGRKPKTDNDTIESVESGE